MYDEVDLPLSRFAPQLASVYVCHFLKAALLVGFTNTIHPTKHWSICFAVPM